MSRRLLYVLAGAALLAVTVTSCYFRGSEAVSKSGRGTTYYINCAHGDDSNTGTSIRSPWVSLTRANTVRFLPGDSLLLARSSICYGQLWPKGSGAVDAPITLADYGKGRLPIVDGGANESALKLFDQSYWEIKNIETLGGSPYGILVSGHTDHTVLRHIHVSNVTVHDVGGSPSSKKGGLIVFFTTGLGQRFDDILVDGVSAYNTTRWAGISIVGATWSNEAGLKGYKVSRRLAELKGSHVTVRNCIVHDVGGDGIVLKSINHGLIEYSVVYETGQTKVTGMETPNAIWTWNCSQCTVQFNEAYRSHSPTEIDGGLFDSDFYNTDVTIQYNYGHDADGYCVGVFGVNGPDTNVNTVIRYNVCSNNGRRQANATQGEFFYKTWNDGTIKNSRIYNNTVYWNPVDASAPVVNVQADFDPETPNYFFNNIILSKAASMVALNTPTAHRLLSDYNIFWNFESVLLKWRANNVTYTSLASWQAAEGMDLHSVVTNPRLNDSTYNQIGRPTTAFTSTSGSPGVDVGWRTENMGDRDFFGNPLPRSGAVSIGAHQAGGIR
jgi:hypothetical protein